MTKPKFKSGNIGSPEDAKSGTHKRGKKDDEQELCPICDDVCTCGQQAITLTTKSLAARHPATAHHGPGGPSGGRKSDRTGPSKSHSSSGHSYTNANKSGSTFIWDFNVRGQLIPLESLYESESSFSSCSDEYTGSDLNDAFSTSTASSFTAADGGNLSGLSDGSSTEDNVMEDDLMLFYQQLPADGAQQAVLAGRDEAPRISAITPQVLAAISKSLTTNPPQAVISLPMGGPQYPSHGHHDHYSVLLLSEETDISDMEYMLEETGNGILCIDEKEDGDIEMVVVASSPMPAEDAGEEKTSSNGTDGGVDENIPEDGSIVLLEDGAAADSDSDTECDWMRFRRVPVNAFYRRSKGRTFACNHHVYNPSFALRPSSTDPQFIVSTLSHSDSSSGDEMALPAGIHSAASSDGTHCNGDETDYCVFDMIAATTTTTSNTPLIY